ncbi:MAG: tetratricopeptide repeat protein [Armatimonadota bacterium]
MLELIAIVLLASIFMVGWSVWRLFGMWLTDRVINGWELLLILLLMLALLGGASTVGGAIGLGLLLMLLVVAVLIAVMPAAAQAIGARRLEQQDIANLYAALKRQPDVPYPHRRLGEIYEQREDWDRAIEHYQAYIEVHPASAADIQRALERCLAAKRRRDLGLRRCPVCGTDHPHEAVRCDQCGFYLQGSREIIDTLTTPEMMRLWRWLIVVFLVPALLIGIFAHTGVPALVSLVMLLCSVIATIVFVFGRMRG